MGKRLEKEDVNAIVICCTQTGSNDELTMEDLDRLHRARGMLEIGYHYVIDRDGEVNIYKGLSERGTCIRGHNHECITVCLVGGADEDNDPQDNFTDAQMEVLEELVTYLIEYFDYPSVVGEGDLLGLYNDPFNVRLWAKKQLGLY